MKRATMFLAFCAPLALHAQSVRGRVTNTDGSPLPFARVGLLADSLRSAPRLAQADADANGRFAFMTVPDGARFMWIGRIGYAPVIVRLPGSPGDSIVVALEEWRVGQHRRDSVERVRHLARVAIARSRPRHWVCTLGDAVARKRAAAAYLEFVAAEPAMMGKTGIEYDVPKDSAAFVRMFVRPLSGDECRRFVEGYERHSSGFETDTVEVYPFGRALYLPWLGDAGGGFADADGKVLTIFIVPD